MSEAGDQPCVIGWINTTPGPTPVVSTVLSRADRWAMAKIKFQALRPARHF